MPLLSRLNKFHSCQWIRFPRKRLCREMAEGSIHRVVTRATKFQKKFVLPPNFSEVLKGFTREVLRDQPEDIHAFGAAYFKKVPALPWSLANRLFCKALNRKGDSKDISVTASLPKIS